VSLDDLEKGLPFRMVARSAAFAAPRVSLINDRKFASASSIISCRTGGAECPSPCLLHLPQMHGLNVKADQADTLRQGIGRLQHVQANSSNIKCKSLKYGRS
jgi:hypothetical protein